MRTTRAFIAGFGTTGSMVAAAACLFVVISAVVAFNGWPGVGIGERLGNLVIHDQPAAAWDVPGPQAAADVARSAAAGVSAQPKPVPLRSSTGVVLGASPTTTGPAQVIAPTTDGNAGRPPARPSLPTCLLAPSTPGCSPSPAGPAVQDLTSALSSAVGDTTGGLSGTLGALNPTLGDAVSSTGQTLSDVLSGLPPQLGLGSGG